MSAFNGLKFTTRGIALQAKVQAGAQLKFTRIALGDGELGGSNISDLTSLKHEVKSLGIAKLTTLSGGTAAVGTVLSNQAITTGFYWREVGVFALDPDVGEVLYCYGNAGAAAEYIPAGGGADILNKHIDVVSVVGNASNVTATIDDSLVYATKEDIQNLQDQINAISVTDTTITLDATQITGTNTGPLQSILNWFANRLKTITGKNNWWESPLTNLEATYNHMTSTSAHSATSSPMPGQIIIRDSSGRAKVAAPAVADDIARKDTVDNHAALTTTAHGGLVPSSDVVTAAAANKLLKLDANGKLPASITGDAATLGGIAASGFMQGRISGGYSQAAVTNMYSGEARSISIPLGLAVKYGWITLVNAQGSALIFFTNQSSFFSVLQQTSSTKSIVCDSTNAFQPGSANYALSLLYSQGIVSLMDCYVFGTNLIIVIENHTGYNNINTLAFSGKWAGVY
ncbi:MAG TPA: phage tail protein [Clostridia bacterium]